jgi:NADH-quinone oxidoreductase subunit H
MTWNLFWHQFFLNPQIPASQWYIDLLRIIVRVLIPVLFILIIVPGLVWFERRLLGWMQQRQGPNRVGPFGLLQTIADGVKLLMKEDIIPTHVDKTLYIAAPIVMLIPALVTGGVIPWNPSSTWGAGAPNVNVGILYILAWASLGVYGVVLAGWSSNNKYSLLGGLRSSAQMVSYELGMGLAIITVVLMSSSLSPPDIVKDQSATWFGFIEQWHVWQFFPIGFVAMLIYCIAMLAETNRAPFDLPEAETELVAGYHTEYTSMKFAIFFMGEYANMMVVSAIISTLFFGGYLAPFSFLDHLPSSLPNTLPVEIINAIIPAFWLVLKIVGFLYFFIWIRATLPRLRYDQLMEFGWKGILPIALLNVLCAAIATMNYWIGLIVWIVLAVAILMIAASTRATKQFTAKTHTDRRVRLVSTVQPFSAVAEHAGRGGQTLPPQALAAGLVATNEPEADALNREEEQVR